MITVLYAAIRPETKFYLKVLNINIYKQKAGRGNPPENFFS